MEDKKLLESLLKDEKFIAKLNDAEDFQKVKELFESEGLVLSISECEEVLNVLNYITLKAQNGEKVSDEDLENVSGGSAFKKIVGQALIGMSLYVGYNVYKNVDNIRKNNGGKIPLSEGSKKVRSAFNRGVNMLDQVAESVTEKITGQKIVDINKTLDNL